MTRAFAIATLGVAVSCGDAAAPSATSGDTGDASDATTEDEGASTAADDTTAATSASVESTGPDDPFVPPEDVADALPLEVVGVCPDAGICAEVVAAIEIAELPADIEDLRARLLVHNVVQLDSTVLALNGSEAVALGGALVRPHGGVASGEVVLDPTALLPGTNWLVFRYTRQVPDVSGFRVLAAEIVADDVTLGALELPWSEPSTWQAPSAAPDVELGGSYFADVSRDGGPVCAACHAIDGADLQYFAFSNHAIVERARHHLFSVDDAEQIASYLRELPVAAPGRIFEPPFQPGPANALAAGAGHDAVVDDDAFGDAVFGPGGWTALPDDIPWTWVDDEGLDPFLVPAPVQVPAWFQWLPRSINPVWFEIPLDGDGNTLRDAEVALFESGTLEDAQRFMAFAVALGNKILAGADPELSPGSDHVQRIQLLRFAAVRLWEWSRAQDDFADPERGFPAGTPPYPYEVGFAFFEAAQADALATDAWRQTIEWWWVQLVLDAGSGASNGLRPLNWADVLIAAREAGLGPNALVYLHLFGSWEESRGTMADAFGTELGPVRLLSTPMSVLDGDGVTRLFRRFLRKEAEWIAGGGSTTPQHHAQLAAAWMSYCAVIPAITRTELRAIVDDAEVQADLAACP